MGSPSFRLIGGCSELVVSIDSRSWHILDEPDLFPDGMVLRKAFGVTYAQGLFKEPPFGTLQRLSSQMFKTSCERAWESLLRDKDYLCFSYQFELEREKGIRHGGGMGNAFHIRGLLGSIKATPKGYCTVRLRSASPDPSGRLPIMEIIDLRKLGRIETDDVGWIKVHRRAMTVDWYKEMPRVLEFCEQNDNGYVEVRVHDD